MKIKQLFFVFCILFSLPLTASGKTGAEFLKLGVNARSLGMGTAFTAIADDASALYWNPAGLSLLRKNELAFMHNEYFMNINYEYLAYIIPLGKYFASGCDIHYLYINDIRSYDIYGNPGNKISAYDSSLALGGSYAFINNDDNFVSIGLSYKFIQQKLVDVRSQSLAVDFGALYKFFKNKAGLGFTARNMALKKIQFISEKEKLPLEFRFGFSYTIPAKTAALTLSKDFIIPKEDDSYSATGAELSFWKNFILRSGFRTAQDEASGWSYGFGTIIGATNFDYAFIPYGDLGESHVITIALQFGDSRKDVITIGNEERASIHYDRALNFKMEGDDIAAAYELDACLKFFSNYRDAKPLLDSEIHYFYARGSQAYDEKQYEESLKWLNLALRYNPKHREANKLIKKVKRKVKK